MNNICRQIIRQDYQIYLENDFFAKCTEEKNLLHFTKQILLHFIYNLTFILKFLTSERTVLY